MEAARKKSFGASERARLREILRAEIAATPLAKGEKTPFYDRWSFWPFVGNLTIFLKPTSAVFFIVLALGASASLAAERALPGDLLYRVKTNVNEKVEAFLAVTPKAKAEHRVSLVEKRLVEVEKLAVSGRVEKAPQKTQAVVRDNFNAQVERARESIEALAKEQNLDMAIDASSQMEAAISAHEQILKTFKNADDTQKAGHLDDFVEQVQQKKNEALETRESVEASFIISRGDASDEAEASAQSKRLEAEQKIVDVRLFVDNLSVDLSEEAIKKLAEADNIIAEGNKKITEKAWNEAIKIFQESIRRAEEAKIIANAEKTLNITIKTEQSDSDGENSDEEKTPEINEEGGRN